MVKRVLVIFLFLFLAFLFVRDIKEKPTFQNQEKEKISLGLPVHLTIPIIDVNADIESVGVTVKGEMDVPSNIMNVGWFSLGPRPGEKGSAVIAGHLDGKNGERAVFADLYKLTKGDKIYTKDDRGVTSIFEVREIRNYDTGYAEEVFSSNDKEHLNLITCNGLWDANKKSFSKRLVVFSDMLTNI